MHCLFVEHAEVWARVEKLRSTDTHDKKAAADDVTRSLALSGKNAAERKEEGEERKKLLEVYCARPRGAEWEVSPLIQSLQASDLV